MQRLLGQSDFAKKFLQRALEVSKEVVGQDHHYVAALVGQVSHLNTSQIGISWDVNCVLDTYRKIMDRFIPNEDHTMLPC